MQVSDVDGGDSLAALHVGDGRRAKHGASRWVANLGR